MAVRQIPQYYVYEHWRLDKDECFYVGKGKGQRAYEKSKRGSHWENIVRKLERIGSAYEIRMVKTGLTEKEAFALEKERIAFWRDRVDLANKTDGGEGVSGLRHTEKSKSQMSSKRIGNQFAKGYRHTEEFKLAKGISFIGDNNPMRNPAIAKKTSESLRAKGDNHSTKRPEVRAKISEGRKGKLVGDDNPSKRPEVRAKISAARKGIVTNLGRKHSQESIELMRQAAINRWANRKQQTGA